MLYVSENALDYFPQLFFKHIKSFIFFNNSNTHINILSKTVLVCGQSPFSGGYVCELNHLFFFFFFSMGSWDGHLCVSQQERGKNRTDEPDPLLILQGRSLDPRKVTGLAKIIDRAGLFTGTCVPCGLFLSFYGGFHPPQATASLTNLSSWRKQVYEHLLSKCPAKRQRHTNFRMASPELQISTSLLSPFQPEFTFAVKDLNIIKGRKTGQLMAKSGSECFLLPPWLIWKQKTKKQKPTVM